jgi:hypothetical protein
MTTSTPRRARRALLGLALVLTFLTTGAASCQRHVYGASLGAQLVADGATAGDGNTWHVESGATFERWTTDIQARAAKTPAAISLGSGLFVNQAATWKGDRGWTADDQAIISWTIASIPKSTCVDVILPAVTDQANVTYPGLTDEVDAARAWAIDVLGPRVDHLLDWRPWVDAHPTEMADGIHMGTQGAVDAYYALTTSGCL